MALQVKELAEGRGCITQAGEEKKREAGPSPFSNTDALLAQLMICCGWHTLRHDHTISCQIWRPGTKTLRAAKPWASTAAVGRGQAIKTLFRVWCSGDAAKPPSQLAASEIGNPTLPSVPCRTLLPADKSTCVTSQRIRLGTRLFQAFTPTRQTSRLKWLQEHYCQHKAEREAH